MACCETWKVNHLFIIFEIIFRQHCYPALISKRSVLAGFSDQIRAGVFANLYCFFNTVSFCSFFFFLKTNILIKFISLFHNKIDPVYIICFGTFLGYHIRYTQVAILHICVVVKERKWRKLQKTMTKMTKFLQYLESSGKFRKNFLCKVYIGFQLAICNSWLNYNFSQITFFEKLRKVWIKEQNNFKRRN